MERPVHARAPRVRAEAVEERRERAEVLVIDELVRAEHERRATGRGRKHELAPPAEREVELLEHVTVLAEGVRDGLGDGRAHWPVRQPVEEQLHVGPIGGVLLGARRGRRVGERPRDARACLDVLHQARCGVVPRVAAAPAPASAPAAPAPVMRARSRLSLHSATFQIGTGRFTATANMRSLLVVCTPDGAPDGRAAQLGQGLAVFVRELFAGMTANYARVEIDVRSHTQLDDLTPARDVPISREQPAQFDKVKRLDMIDLVFVYATADFAPWADAAQPARWFVRNCLLARKCVLAWGGGMQLVAYVLGTGGDISATPVRSVDGAPLSTMMPPGSRLPAGRLALDAHTGELLQWNPSSRSWLALPATCGSHLHSGHPDAPFRRVDERGSTVRDLHFARSADCRQISANVHAQAVRHPLIRGAIAARAQLEVRNAWSCHLRARGSFGRLGELRTLLVHPHGVQAFEVGNCVALQCELSAHYAAGPALARRFCERALALLALLREGEMRGTLAPHAPLPLAYIVGQRTIDGIPSAMLDTVALLAPESDTARIAFRTQRGMLTERGAGPAEDARSPRAASETKRWSARQELHSITPPTRPAPAASGARPRPSSARTRTVADTASPASPAPPARVALGGPSPLRTRPASAHVRGSSAAAHATTLVAIAGGPHDRPSTARNVRPGAGER